MPSNNHGKRKIKSFRISSKKYLEFKQKLRLNPYKYNFDEQDIISALKVTFEGEVMHTKCFIQNKRSDIYFPEHKLAIEIDEYDHVDRILNMNKVDK